MIRKHRYVYDYSVDTQPFSTTPVDYHRCLVCEDMTTLPAETLQSLPLSMGHCPSGKALGLWELIRHTVLLGNLNCLEDTSLLQSPFTRRFWRPSLGTPPWRTA